MNTVVRPPILVSIATLTLLGCTQPAEQAPGAGAPSQHMRDAERASGPAVASQPGVKVTAAVAGAPTVLQVSLMRQPASGALPADPKSADFYPGVGDAIRAVATTQDPDGDGVTVDWRWFVNNNLVSGASLETLQPSQGRYKKGDRIKAEATPKDTRGKIGAPFSGETIVKNSPPAVNGGAGVSLNNYRVPAVDPDGDVMSFALEAPVPGFTLSSAGLLTVDAAQAAAARGKSLVVVVKDNDSGVTKFQIPIQF